jgi:GT2 family glycosyltransferase
VRCLEALAAQTLPHDSYEVIVCDDGNAQPLTPSIDHLGNQMALTVVRQRNAGPAAARNEGARLARSRFVAFTDDDCVPAQDWLARLLARFQQTPSNLVAGSIMNLLPDDPYATATQLIMDSVYEYHTRNSSQQQFFSTTNLAVPVDRFWEIDGFSTAFPRAAGEDYDFCARWHEAGFASTYAPEAIVGHAHPHDLRSFWKQHFGYGRALLRVREGIAHRQGRSGIDLESPGFYRQLLTYPLQNGLAGRALKHAAFVLLSQVATAAGAARERFLAGDWKVVEGMGAEQKSPDTSSAAR